MCRASIRVSAVATVLLFLVAGMVPVVHSVQHTDRDEECAACLAHGGSPALVRDCMPFDANAGSRQWSAPDQPQLAHARHGTPFSGRGPPPCPA